MATKRQPNMFVLSPCGPIKVLQGLSGFGILEVLARAIAMAMGVAMAMDLLAMGVR